MKKYFLLIIGFGVLLSSCRKFLEQPSYNNISVDDIFKDFDGARTTLVGLYDNLKSTNYYLRDAYIYADLTGGNIKYSRTSNQLLFYTYSFTRDELNNELSGLYQEAYNTIYGANNLMKNIDRVADISSPQRARLLAEALTIRALVHFDLVRTFAQPYNFTSNADHPGIVLKTETSSVLTPTDPVSTVKQVYDQVIKDIDSALSLYNKSIPIFATGSVQTWLSADAAKAIKNRVNLYRENWQAVITGVTELLSSNKYPLTSNANYISSWSKQNIATESIFELAYGNRIGGSLGDYYNSANKQYGQLAATEDLLSLYSSGDVRNRNSFFVTTTVNGSPYYFTRKYQGMSDSANNIKLFRASELYLNRAEAYAKSGNLTSALADLNTIRKRANPAAVDFSSTDQQQVINEILLERRRELAFEGHLFYDLARNKKDLVRIDCTAQIKSFTYPNSLFAYPIPKYQ